MSCACHEFGLLVEQRYQIAGTWGAWATLEDLHAEFLDDLSHLVYGVEAAFFIKRNEFTGLDTFSNESAPSANDQLAELRFALKRSKVRIKITWDTYDGGGTTGSSSFLLTAASPTHTLSPAVNTGVRTIHIKPSPFHL